MRKQYRKKDNQFVIAVKIELDTEGFTYQKWGATQNCKPGDWLVKNGDDTYTIDQEVFNNTYRQVADGKFVKTTPIWAEIAQQDGSVKTKEGESHYKAGDYIVSNNEDGSDAYCITAKKFTQMYQLVN